MKSILICFTLVTVVISEKMKTREGGTCIFPFKYNGKWHTTCVPDQYNPHYGPWCAVIHEDYDSHLRMGHCINKTIVPTKTLGGKDCVFPFKYNGEEYYRCALDKLSTWCALESGDYKNHRKWGYCQGGHQNPETGRKGRVALNETLMDYRTALKQILTVSGRPCRFPFFWRNLKHYECARDFRNNPWCMVDDTKWDYCLLYHKTEPKYSFDALFHKIGSTKEPVADNCKVKKVRFINDNDRATIVKYANKIRINTPGGNLRKLTWSEHLAERAQYFADLCSTNHGETTSCYGDELGQNMVTGFSHKPINWKYYIYWLFGTMEKKHYDYTKNACNATTCGHYTQSAWAETNEIGCAYSNCTNLDGNPDQIFQIAACNYYPKGNMPQYGAVNTIRRPYIKGESCEFCRYMTYPYQYKCEDNHFCEPCRAANEEGCVKYDLCMDSNIYTDSCQNERRISTGCVQYRQEVVKSRGAYAAIRHACRKSCNMCKEPYDLET